MCRVGNHDNAWLLAFTNTTVVVAWGTQRVKCAAERKRTQNRVASKMAVVENRARVGGVRN